MQGTKTVVPHSSKSIDRRNFLTLSGLVGGGLFLATSRKHISAQGLEPIAIGALCPLTGAGGSYGPGMVEAIEIAVEEVNAAGGPLGRPFELFVEDSQTDPDAAVRAAKKLIEVNGAVAIMGTWASAVSLAVAPLAIDANVIHMNTSGSPDLTTLEDNDMVWRLQASNTLFGEAFAKAVLSRGYKKAATIAINNPSGIGNVTEFKKYFESEGGTVVEEVVYNANQSSYRSEVETVLDAEPEIVVMGSYAPDATIVLKEWYQTGVEMKWLGPAFAINQQLIDALGSDVVEGVLAVDSIPDQSSEAYDRLHELYMEATDTDLFNNIYAPMTYDMVHLLALAIEAAGSTDGEAISVQLEDISGADGEAVSSFEQGAELLRAGESIDYQGASSVVDFDSAGDVRPTFGVFEIQEGAPALVEEISMR